MDEHNELPDDFSQWSDSYWDWFNLDSQSATYDELRKAYSRLIKHFRPETHPEQFQRIQAAFEILRELSQANPQKTVQKSFPSLQTTSSTR